MNKYDNDEINRKSREVWENFVKLQPDTNLMFPDENLIRILSQRYVKVPKPPAKVLDHGFGSGNNLIFFSSKGYECFGCEIAEELIKITQEKFDKFNKPVDLKLIHGDYLDYNENFFDIIVSWNTIHYLGKREKVLTIIDEFHRILKPEGVLILSTLHPDNSLLKRAVLIGNGTYEVIKESRFDNRKGLLLFATNGKDQLMEIFEKFSEVKYGYYNFDLFLPEKNMAAQLIYATK